MLIPRVDKEKKLSDYKNKGQCIDWLMDNPEWETAMKNAEKEALHTRQALQPKLFEHVPKNQAEC